MLKRSFIFISLCLIVFIMVSCSNDIISIEFKTWDLNEDIYDRTEIEAPCDDQILYFYMIREAQIDINAVLGGKTPLRHSNIILEADDPTVIQITSAASGFSDLTKKLLVLRPEARKAHLTLTLSFDGRIEKKKIVLVFVEMLIWNNGSKAVDFDAGEFVTMTEWNAMDEIRQANFDLFLDHRSINVGSSYPFEYILDFAHGQISLPPHLFAAYDFYPETNDLPVSDSVISRSEYLPKMFVVESSEGRIYKMLLDCGRINFTEILAAD